MRVPGSNSGAGKSLQVQTCIREVFHCYIVSFYILRNYVNFLYYSHILPLQPSMGKQELKIWLNAVDVFERNLQHVLKDGRTIATTNHVGGMPYVTGCCTVCYIDSC